MLSLSLLLQMTGDLGGLDMLGRLVPGWSQEGSAGRTQDRLAGLATDLGPPGHRRPGDGGAGCGGALAGAVALAGQGALIGLGVAARILSWTPFHLSYGLNRMGRWAVDLSWRQLVLIPCLLAALPWGLTGLLVGNLVAELVFLLLAATWLRPYVHPRRPPGRDPALSCASAPASSPPTWSWSCSIAAAPSCWNC